MDSVLPDEIPDGFTAVDPNNPSAAGGAGNPKKAEAQAKDDQRRGILEQALTSEALARLGTLKMVKPEKASAVEALIASMALSGKLPGRISEGKLIEMLEGIGAKQKQPSSINIQRKRYAFDSDEDDDDDDLM